MQQTNQPANQKQHMLHIDLAAFTFVSVSSYLFYDFIKSI